jgi:hypothetical protein
VRLAGPTGHVRLALVGGALALAISRPASADERITDDTAYKTPEGQVRAGLWKLQYGVHGVRGLEIGTYTLPYVTWAFDVRSVNTQVKYQFFDKRVWTLSSQLGLAYVDLGGIDVDARVAVVPIQVLAAARLGSRFTLGLGLMYTSIAGEGGYNADETDAFRGAIAVSNVQSWISLTTRLSRGWSLYLESRAIASTEATGNGDLTLALDDRTTVDVALTGNASIEELRGGSTLVALQWASRERFRIRFGLGYGNYNIPVINFIIPVATPFPELDLYFVF